MVDEIEDKSIFFRALTTQFPAVLLKLGSFLKSMGEMEKQNSEMFSKMNEVTKDTNKLIEYVNELNAEDRAKILELIFRLGALQPRLQSVVNLTSDDKIKLGDEVNKLSEEFKKINVALKTTNNIEH